MLMKKRKKSELYQAVKLGEESTEKKLKEDTVPNQSQLISESLLDLIVDYSQQVIESTTRLCNNYHQLILQPPKQVTSDILLHWRLAKRVGGELLKCSMVGELSSSLIHSLTLFSTKDIAILRPEFGLRLFPSVTKLIGLNDKIITLVQNLFVERSKTKEKLDLKEKKRKIGTRKKRKRCKRKRREKKIRREKKDIKKVKKEKKKSL